MGTRLCLNMIVKDESAIIERALRAAAPHLSCYVIADTGSTDDTVANAAKSTRFARLETVIGMYLNRLFPGFIAKSQGAFRVLRDSDIEVREDAEDLVALYETALKRRRRGHVIRREVDGLMPERLQQFVAQELEIREDAVFEKEGLLGLADTKQLIVS